jgi:hypothetical protein
VSQRARDREHIITPFVSVDSWRCSDAYNLITLLCTLYDFSCLCIVSCRGCYICMVLSPSAEPKRKTRSIDQPWCFVRALGTMCRFASVLLLRHEVSERMKTQTAQSASEYSADDETVVNERLSWILEAETTQTKRERESGCVLNTTPNPQPPCMMERRY